MREIGSITQERHNKADFPTETRQIRREWQEIFQVIKSKGLQPRLLYPARLSFKMEGEINSFPDKNVKIVHLYQTSIARHTKGKALKRWRKKVKERGTQVKKGTWQ